MLGRLSSTLKTVVEAMNEYQFQRAIQEILRFATADLSNFYLDIAKDRLYISGVDDIRRRSCQTVIQACLEGFAKSITPILPHMAEDIWQNLPYDKPTESVFEGGWPTSLMSYDSHDADDWELVRQLRDDVNKVLESARNDKLVGASLDAAAYVYVPDESKRAILEKLVGDENMVQPPVKTNGVDELRTVLMLSQVHVIGEESKLREACDEKYISSTDTLSGCVVGVKAAGGRKCARCWFYDETPEPKDDEFDVCQRCNDAIRSWEKQRGESFVMTAEEGSVFMKPSPVGQS